MLQFTNLKAVVYIAFDCDSGVFEGQRKEVKGAFVCCDKLRGGH